MQLATITMDRDEAEARYEEYRKTAHADLSKEFARIMHGFKALSKGSKLIDLDKTVQAGGTVVKLGFGEPYTLPAIAVMRADKPWCHIESINAQRIRFHAHESPRGHWNADRVTVQTGDLELSEVSTWQRFKAPTPIVPPKHRPPLALSNYHIMWEADWQPYQPVDPALLRHIGGPIYAVVAEWDLTPLEAAILRDSTVSG